MSKYAYCSAPNCKHYQLYGQSSDGKRTVSMQKYCTQCGSPMIGKCPNCGADRASMDYKCCPDCGKPYK